MKNLKKKGRQPKDEEDTNRLRGNYTSKKS